MKSGFLPSKANTATRGPSNPLESIPSCTRNPTYALVDDNLQDKLPSCCRQQLCESSSSIQSTWVLPLQSLHADKDSKLTKIEFRCMKKRASEVHSKWVPMDSITVASTVEDVPRALSLPPAHSHSNAPHTFEVQNPHVSLLCADHEIGRFLTVRDECAPGTRVLEATAFAVTLHDKCVQTLCHWCFTDLERKAFQCGSCQFARYCSRKCMDNDTALHDFQCGSLRRIQKFDQMRSQHSSGKLHSSRESIGRQRPTSAVDSETIRLTLAVLSMESFIDSANALQGLQLPSQCLSSKEESDLAAAAKFIHASLLEEEIIVPVDHIRAILRKVQTNAHTLNADGLREIGIGIFPEAAMTVNHSCCPNVLPTFDPNSRTLSFQALKTLGKGEVVEMSYIEVFSDVSKRKELLLNAFGFKCCCSRCCRDLRKEQLPAEETERVLSSLQHLLTPSSKLLPTVLREMSQHKEQEASVYTKSSELRFLFYLGKMQLLINGKMRTSRQEEELISTIQTLLRLWKEEALPPIHSTPLLLLKHLEKILRDQRRLSEADEAYDRADMIYRTCGFPLGLPVRT